MIRDETLGCEGCQLLFPIKEGMPVFLSEETLSWEEQVSSPSIREPSLNYAPIPGGQKVAVFTVVEGKNSGKVVRLEKSTCKAIGRSLDDKEKTQVFSVESAASLDDFSKKLVMNYIGRQFEKKERGSGDLGSFRRLADWPLDDVSVSRLHAMIFFGDSGVGILDLVSKNGTYVNGVEVESRLLKESDLIAIGGTKIRFQMG